MKSSKRDLAQDETSRDTPRFEMTSLQKKSPRYDIKRSCSRNIISRQDIPKQVLRRCISRDLALDEISQNLARLHIKRYRSRRYLSSQISSLSKRDLIDIISRNPARYLRETRYLQEISLRFCSRREMYQKNLRDEFIISRGLDEISKDLIRDGISREISFDMTSLNRDDISSKITFSPGR